MQRVAEAKSVEDSTSPPLPTTLSPPDNVRKAGRRSSSVFFPPADLLSRFLGRHRRRGRAEVGIHTPWPTSRPWSLPSQSIRLTGRGRRCGPEPHDDNIVNIARTLSRWRAVWHARDWVHANKTVHQSRLVSPHRGGFCFFLSVSISLFFFSVALFFFFTTQLLTEETGTEAAWGRLKMILRVAPGGIVLLLALAGSVGGQDDDSLASSFISGKNRPYHDVIVCGRTLRGIGVYQVLIQCAAFYENTLPSLNRVELLWLVRIVLFRRRLYRFTRLRQTRKVMWKIQLELYISILADVSYRCAEELRDAAGFMHVMLCIGQELRKAMSVRRRFSPDPRSFIARKFMVLRAVYNRVILGDGRRMRTREWSSTRKNAQLLRSTKCNAALNDVFYRFAHVTDIFINAFIRANSFAFNEFSNLQSEIMSQELSL